MNEASVVYYTRQNNKVEKVKRPKEMKRELTSFQTMYQSERTSTKKNDEKSALVDARNDETIILK